MPNIRRRRTCGIALALCLACGFAAAGDTSERLTPSVPVIRLVDECSVTDMLVIGPFPHPFSVTRAAEQRRALEAVDRAGFDVDFLAAVGGEANPRLEALADGAPVVEGYNAVAKRITGSLTGWDKLFTPDTYAVAYGVVDIEAERPQSVHMLFGSDDYAKIWVNGEGIHEDWRDGGRDVDPDEVKRQVALRPGRNRFVFKIEQKTGGWGMALTLLTEAGRAARAKAKAAAFKRQRLFEQPLLTSDEDGASFGRRLIPVGPLPTLLFQNPELAAELAEMETFTVRWFDAALNETTLADKEGPYFAYATVRTKEGPTIRRVVPVYAISSWEGYASSRLFRHASFPWKKNIRPSLPERAWNEHQDLLAATVGHGWDWLAAQQDDMPLWLAEVALDTRPAGAWRESMYSNVHDLLVRLRRKVLNRPAAKILPPPVDDPAATALRLPGAGGLAEAGMAADAADRIRAACRAWRDATDLGFAIVVARRGVIVLHEAFPGAKDVERVHPNELKNGMVTVASRLPTASVTKLHAGVLLGRFIDQGWVDLDDPVAKFFPDFPESGPKRVTVRQLMTHTSGLTGHRFWLGLNGMVNPFLDNVARWELQGVTPGAVDHYNGLGIDLGGKIMEDIAGMGAFRAMREGLFEPLGQDNPTINDLGYGLNCTVMDLARVAEMLRQGGAYAGKRYFSRATFAELLPRPYGDSNPNIREDRKEIEYGVGFTWMRDLVHDIERSDGAKWDDSRPKQYRLGLNVFGNGSATGAVFRVAPDHELIVAMTRYEPGEGYSIHLDAVLKAIAESFEEGR